MTEDLVRKVFSAVGPLTNREVPSPTLFAFTANDGERYDDPIPLLELSVDGGTHLYNFSHHLVAHDVPWKHRRNEVVKQMKIGAADCAARHFDDCVPWLLDLRI